MKYVSFYKQTTGDTLHSLFVGQFIGVDYTYIWALFYAFLMRSWFKYLLPVYITF
jgi:hypothetical protein